MPFLCILLRRQTEVSEPTVAVCLSCLSLLTAMFCLMSLCCSREGVGLRCLSLSFAVDVSFDVDMSLQVYIAKTLNLPI